MLGRGGSGFRTEVKGMRVEVLKSSESALLMFWLESFGVQWLRA